MKRRVIKTAVNNYISTKQSLGEMDTFLKTKPTKSNLGRNRKSEKLIASMEIK